MAIEGGRGRSFQRHASPFEGVHNEKKSSEVTVLEPISQEQSRGPAVNGFQRNDEQPRKKNETLIKKKY